MADNNVEIIDNQEVVNSMENQGETTISPKTSKTPKPHALSEEEEVSELLQDVLEEEYDEETMGEWGMEDLEVSEEIPHTPTFSEKVKDTLPDFLKQVVSKSESNEDADLLVLGSIVVLSSCMTNITGIYHHDTVSPNLFLFVSAPPSSGKSRLKLCKHLIWPIHDYLRRESETNLAEYNRTVATTTDNTRATPPPPIKTLIIPADSSTTSVYQLLNDNGGKGLIFETEGDTLANKFKSDYGDFSEGLRKGFHHETIAYSRRKDREFVEISNPYLSVVLAGTPNQVVSLIPSEENGLFSRFIFYSMNLDLHWKNVFPKVEISHDNFFKDLGKKFYEFYCQFLGDHSPISVKLTREQEYKFNKFFAKLTILYFHHLGVDFVATTHRLGLIAYRIILVLTMLRMMETGDVSPEQECSQEDYINALTIVSILVQHSAMMFNVLPSSGHGSFDNGETILKQNFLRKLPRDFETQKFIAVGEELGIPQKTAEKYIRGFCKKGKLKHVSQGKYSKP